MSFSPPALGRVFGLLLVAVVAVAASCGPARFDRQLAVHAELLRTMADDAVAGLEQGAAMPEILSLRYPLSRARGLAEQGARRYPGRPGLDVFDALVTDYASLVEHLDRTRALAGTVDAVGASAIAEARGLARRVADGHRRLNEVLAPETGPA